MGTAQGVVIAEAAMAGMPGSDAVMVLALLLPIMLLVTIALVTFSSRRGLLGGPRRDVDVSTPLVAVAAALSLGAAGIHFAVVQPHLDEDPAAAVFFLALAWFQSVWALAYLLRPTDFLRITGVFVNAAVIALWIVSRTTGLPIGPTPFQPEAIGVADLMSTSFEIVLVTLLAAALGARFSGQVAGRRVSVEKAYVLVAYSFVLVVTLTGMALLGAPAG